ncbi:unnamed protein product [Cuscuta campestris]|uniref:CCHC-type domain-containing protein n=1 Tax=Cuscuta campestris TaxID=132261 RepID=A0A484LIL4_9ASTE|nr:unnamed protein product [Cuscuta campestris]
MASTQSSYAGLGEGQSTTRPPLFDGTNYTYWKERMRIYIQSTNFLLWRIIKNGEDVPMKKVRETNVPKTENEYDVQDIKKVENNAKAINIIYCAVNPDDYRKISYCSTAKEMWDKLEITYEGTDQETYTDKELVRKSLRNLTPEWRCKADAIQESIGVTNVTIDGLRGNLKTYVSTILLPSLVEQKKKGIALKASSSQEPAMEESSDEDNEFGLVIKKFYKFMRKEYERKGKKHGGPPKCYGCGEVGHIKPKCSNAKNKKEKKPLKKHRAYISWGGDSGDKSSEGEENESANLFLMAHEEPPEEVCTTSKDSYSFDDVQEAFNELYDEYVNASKINKDLKKQLTSMEKEVDKLSKDNEKLKEENKFFGKRSADKPESSKCSSCTSLKQQVAKLEGTLKKFGVSHKNLNDVIDNLQLTKHGLGKVSCDDLVDSLENIYLNDNDEGNNSKDGQDEEVEPSMNEEQPQEEETQMPRAWRTSKDHPLDKPNFCKFPLFSLYFVEMAGGQRKRSRTGKNVASISTPLPPAHKYLDGSFLRFNDRTEATRFSEKFEHREILPPRFSTARFIHDSIPREARVILERGNFLDLLYIKKAHYQPFLIRAFYSNLTKDEDGAFISNVNGVDIYLNEENIQILTGLRRNGEDLGLYVGEGGAQFNETALLEEVGIRIFAPTPQQRRPTITSMNPVFRFIFYVLTRILKPRKFNHTALSQEDTKTLHAMIHNANINWCKFVMTHMFSATSDDRPLPYALLVMAILDEYNIKTDVGPKIKGTKHWEIDESSFHSGTDETLFRQPRPRRQARDTSSNTPSLAEQMAALTATLSRIDTNVSQTAQNVNILSHELHGYFDFVNYPYAPPPNLGGEPSGTNNVGGEEEVNDEEEEEEEAEEEEEDDDDDDVEDEEEEEEEDIDEEQLLDDLSPDF